MSKILIPGEDDTPTTETNETQEQQPQTPEYKATEEDEERFFLMYHMNFQPSEADRLAPAYRKWLIMRFIAQKNMEQEAVERHRLMQQLGPKLKV